MVRPAAGLRRKTCITMVIRLGSDRTLASQATPGSKMRTLVAHTDDVEVATVEEGVFRLIWLPGPGGLAGNNHVWLSGNMVLRQLGDAGQCLQVVII